MKQYELNRLDENTYQIYGEVNGFAFTHYHQGIYTYHLDFKFFVKSRLIHIMTSEKDNTMTSEKSIINRINKIIK